MARNHREFNGLISIKFLDHQASAETLSRGFQNGLCPVLEFNGFNLKSLRYVTASQRIFQESFGLISALCTNLTG